MSDTLPNEVREGVKAAMRNQPNGWRIDEDTMLDAALSALEAAGFEVNRKGTALDCPLPADAELWADGAHLIARWPEHYTEAGCCGNALPSGECCGNAIPVPAVAERVEKVAEGDPGVLAYLASLHNLTASNPKEQSDV